MWSDIPNNVQLRWLEEDGHVSVLRNPAGYSNGNTFDYQGRQLSCEHGNRRVARYEPDGTITTIADRYNGKRLNSPNDIVVHPGGAIWFTDPPYGILGDYEGHRAEPELKEAVYRVDPSNGRVTMVTDEIDRPNGLCFSPDYKRLYVADTGKGANIKVWEVAGDGGLRNGREFVSPGGDGIRCDVDGNIWSASSPGVRIIAPSGEQIGVIRLPEICAQRLLRRQPPQPALHDRQPVPLRRLRRCQGCAHRIGAASHSAGHKKRWPAPRKPQWADTHLGCGYAQL